MFCQLEVLRDCLPPSVRRTLDELPESLDETYERVLNEIKKPNRDHARRLLQCLVVAVRPLRVTELAEVLAVDYDDEDGIPKLNPNWRWEDQEQALLTSCSSLITIVEFDASWVVQFSHFSVKEYLTSTRLATSSGNVLRYHIALEPAHTILAQACMSTLLRLNDHAEENGDENISRLVEYAAEHWVSHAKYENVSSSLRKAMERLFDLDEPYFAAWLQLHDLDTGTAPGSAFNYFKNGKDPGAVPLYYAALCGFQTLVEHLILKNPRHVDASGGYYKRPLVAALAGEHFQIAKLLFDNGAHPNIHGWSEDTPLHSAVYYGYLQTVQVLLECKADVDARNDSGTTPLHYVPCYFAEDPNLDKDKIARCLLDYRADVNARDDRQSTPLHCAARYGSVEVARVLLDHRADVNASDDGQSTPLHIAALEGKAEAVRVLLEHRADVNARDNGQCTPLHRAVQLGRIEVVRVLLEHRANVNARNEDESSPLHIGVERGEIEVVRVLLEHGANVGAEDKDGRTPFRLASLYNRCDIMKLLLEHGVKGT